MNAGILAVHQSGYQARRDDLSLEELIYETVTGLLREAGVSIADVDHVAIASSDGLDGRAISSMVTMSSVGGYFRDLINCSSSGEHALVMAMLRILSGRGRLALVANWGKPSEAPLPVIDNLSFDPFFYRDLRLERTSLLALQATAYAEHASVAPELAARLARAARERARGNPRALKQPATASPELVEGTPRPRPSTGSGNAPVFSSRMAAWPLRVEELPPLADGAVAMLVGSEEAARALGLPFVALAGMGWAYDSYWSGGSDFWWLSSLEAAAQRGYRQAGVANPGESLDVVEVMDVTPYHALMACEALGLCPAGEGGRFAEDLLDGRADVALNPSGGLHAGYTDFAAGLDRVAELYHQLTGAAGSCQVPGARRGLAHAASGFAAQVNSVFILEAAAQ